MEHKSYVTITSGMRGRFCVLVGWFEDEYGGMYEPLNTSPFTFKTTEEAAKYGREWAKNEGVEFRP